MWAITSSQFESQEDRFNAIEERRQENIVSRWPDARSGVLFFLPSSSLNPSGQPLLHLTHPLDGRWDGVDMGLAPIVGTVIPTVETKADPTEQMRSFLQHHTDTLSIESHRF